MARSIETPIATRTGRLKLTPRGAPYHFATVDPGVALGYRRVTSGDGRWIVRAADGKGSSWQQVLAGVADDFQDADGVNVLTFAQAAAAARARVRGGEDTGDDTRRDKPVTIREALVDYRLGQHDASNATRVLHHLPEWFATMPVMAATQKDFKAFTRHMQLKLKPSTVKRTCKNFAAALVMAAKSDDRITNQEAWRGAFAEIRTGAASGRPNYASDAEILALVAACYEADPAFGLFTEVAAQTGARPIQIARLKVASLHANPPRLLMPASAKGRGREARAAKPVPITHELAERLRKAAHGRKIVEPLLVQSDGAPWWRMEKDVMAMSRQWRAATIRAHDGRKCGIFHVIAQQLGLDEGFTFYGLRHSSIIRQLQKKVPTAIVAKCHDTSVPIIEAHYGSYILDFSDEIVRAALLETAATPPAGNVINMRGR